MIDIQSHLLPGVDDGSTDLRMSLEMARIAVADGVRQMVCTPHVVQGVYDNDAKRIEAAVADLRLALIAAGVPLEIYAGADVHVAHDLPSTLVNRTIPTLNNGKYFLLEPPHHVLPPKMDELVMRLIKAGFVPILTHPERLTWIVNNYPVIERLNELGCLIQVTADSVLGFFGRTALFYSERLLDEGRVDVIASDAHGVKARRPGLSRARDVVARRLGENEAIEMVQGRPSRILSNELVVPAGKARMAGGDWKNASISLKKLGRFFGGRVYP